MNNLVRLRIPRSTHPWSLLSLVLVCVLAVTTAWASDFGRIKGRVTDADTKEPVIGAAVEVEGTDLGATTDEHGDYLIITVPAGVQSVLVSAVGYEPKRETDVLVIVDQTVTVNALLKSTMIQITKPIEVTSTRVLVRTQTSTERAMSTSEFSRIPVTNLAQIIALQAGVVSSAAGGGSGIHLRGGRPDEIAYFVDGSATSDPLYGYQAADVNPEATSEVVVMSGGFDAEYGEAMSGIVQVVTKEGGEKTSGRVKYESDDFMPRAVNFDDHTVDASIGGTIPGTAGSRQEAAGRGIRYFIAPELVSSADFDPHRYRLPHHERDDIKGNGKLTYSLPVNAGLKLTASTFLSREEWNEQPSDPTDKNQAGYKYSLDHFLSQRNRTATAELTLDHLITKDLYYDVHLSYFHDDQVRGVRDPVEEAQKYPNGLGLLGDYIFKGEDSVMADSMAIYDMRKYYTQQRYDVELNPFGVQNMFYGIGDYRLFLAHWSTVMTYKGDVTYNIKKVHEIKGGIEVRQNELSRRYNSLPADPNPFVDRYDVKPVNVAAYAEDRMDFEDLVVRVGLRYDFLDPAAYKKLNVVNVEDTAEVAAMMKYKLSPRLGVSFPISERTKFRFSYGHFFQTPAYNYLYEDISADAYKRGNNIIGNPDLQPQQTVAYELGLENELSRIFSIDFTAYYKDIYDLIGTDYQPAVPMGYFPYLNQDYGNVRGLEVTFAKAMANYWSTRVSYTLSMARGTESYANEWYRERYDYGIDPVTGLEMLPPKRDAYLDFDERHTVRADLTFEFPRDFSAVILRDFSLTALFSFGSGLPYSVRQMASGIDFDNGDIIGDRFSARMPPRYQIDGRISKAVRLGPLALTINCDITNLLNTQNIVWVYGATGKPDDDGYASTYSPLNYPATGTGITGGTYNPVRDLDHDGIITPFEEYVANKTAYRDFVNNPNNYGTPRSIQFGISLEF